MAYPYYSYGFFDFNAVLQQWASVGLFDIILPIVLIFTLVYAVLERTRILGGRREIDAIVSLVVGFFAISNPEVSRFLLAIFPNATIGIIILLVFLLIVGLVVPEFKQEGFNLITLIGGFAVFFWVMSRAADAFGGYGFIIFSRGWWYNNAWWIVPLALFGLLVSWVVSGGEEGEAKAKKKKTQEAFKTLGELFR